MTNHWTEVNICVYWIWVTSFFCWISKFNNERRFFVLSRAWLKEKILSPHEELNWNGTSDLRISELQCSTTESQILHDERGLVRSFTWKNNFLYHLTELKINHLSYYIYKHDDIDIADPNSMYNLKRLPKWLSGQFERTQWSLLHLDDSVKT